MRALLELRLLAAVGLRPELERCVRCGRDAIGAVGQTVAFHVGEGGVLCAACDRDAAATLAVHPGTLRALAQGLRLPLDRLDRLALGPGPTAEPRALLAPASEWSASGGISEGASRAISPRSPASTGRIAAPSGGRPTRRSTWSSRFASSLSSA